MDKYRCTVCGYLYEPEKGDPVGNVKPGTAFEDVPEDWQCPECHVPKSMFEKENSDSVMGSTSVAVETQEVSGVVEDIIVRTPFVKSFRVTVPHQIDFKAGQWGLVTIGGDQALSRPLSISSSPTEKGHLEFTKRITASNFSQALSSLKVGDNLDIQYPSGNFLFQNDAPKIAFISGGIGITPIRSICKDLTDRGLGTDIILLYGNNTFEEIAFKDDFEQMQSHNSHLKVVHALRTPPAGWKGATGFISEELIRKEIPDFLDRRFYLCGPPSMVLIFKKILTEKFKLPQTQVITEDFEGYS